MGPIQIHQFHFNIMKTSLIHNIPFHIFNNLLFIFNLPYKFFFSKLLFLNLLHQTFNCRLKFELVIQFFLDFILISQSYYFSVFYAIIQLGNFILFSFDCTFLFINYCLLCLVFALMHQKYAINMFILYFIIFTFLFQLLQLRFLKQGLSLQMNLLTNIEFLDTEKKFLIFSNVLDNTLDTRIYLMQHNRTLFPFIVSFVKGVENQAQKLSSFA